MSSSYPVLLNANVEDVSKRVVSRQIVERPSSWDGPVIVKTDENCFGGADARRRRQHPGVRGAISRLAQRLPTWRQGIRRSKQYPVFEHQSLVPRSIWWDRTLVVERFLPETRGDRFVLRNWVFLGDRGFGYLNLSRKPVVIERFHRFERTFCLNYGIAEEGVRYLGAAEQICDAQGSQQGSWLDSEEAVADDLVEVGRHAGRAGHAQGYRGILGVDVGRAEDGRALAFDLNFRMNLSTAAVVLADAIHGAWGTPCGRIWPALEFPGGFAAMIEVLHRGVSARRLVPLAVHDGSVPGHAPSTPSCTLLVVGADRAEVVRRGDMLRRESLG